MIDFFDIKIYLYLLGILTVVIIPVYLFLDRKLKPTSLVALVYLLFFYLNKNIAWGLVKPYHDSRRAFANIMIIYKQWFVNGDPIGWNPFMHGGEPLALFSNIFLWAPWNVFCWVSKYLSLPEYTLWNLFLIFLFLNFCTGSFLLFYLLYREFKPALFSLFCLVCSTMFFINLGQAANIYVIYYFPYVLFGVLSSFKKKNLFGILFALAFLAVSVNHYLPHYLLLSSGFTIVFISLCFFNRFKSLLSLAVGNYHLLIITFVIGSFLVLPAFYSYIESKNYVSPVRQAEGKTSGLVEADGKILGSCNAPFWGYRILVDGLNNYRANIHHAFYFGIIPLLFSAIALIGYRNRYLWSFFLAMLIILFFGLGNDFWGFRFCSRYVPGFSMFRHTFELGHFVSVLLICLSGYGFKILFSDEINTHRYRQLLTVSFLFLILIGLISQKIHAIVFTIIAILLVVLIATVRRFPDQQNKKIILSFFYLAVFFFSFADLFIIQKYDVWSALSLYQKYSKQVKFPKNSMVYPSRRNLYFSGPDAIYPPDFRPIIFREAIALDKKESFSIFRNSRYNDLIKYSPDIYKTRKTLGVESSLYYLSSKLAVLPRDTPKDVFIRQMYESNQRLEGKVFLYDNDFTDSINIIPAESDRAFIGFRAINRSPNSVEFYINSLNEGILVRRENFHRGWQAFIDGKKTEIFRANHAFSAIHLPAGEHQVRFVFKSVYPVLISIHSFFVFAVTILFNIYLFKYNRIEVD